MTSPSSTYSKFDTADLEPDDGWKKQLKARIQLGLQSLVQDAKDNQFVDLRKAVVTLEERKRLDNNYDAAMASIRQLATEQYQVELEKERNQRRWTVGASVVQSSSTHLKGEQEHAMNTTYSHPLPQSAASAPPATRNPEPRKTRASNIPVASNTGHMSAMTGPGNKTSYGFVKSKEVSFEDAAQFGPESHRGRHSSAQDNSSAGWGTDEPLDKEKRRAYKAIRSRPVGVTVSGHNEPLGWRRGMRSAGPTFAAMHVEDHKFYCKDWLPHTEPQDEHHPPYQEPRYPWQDRVPPRPLSPRSYSAPPANIYPSQPPLYSPCNVDDRGYLAKRDFLAHSSSMRSYNDEDRDYHTPPPAFRSPAPSRSPYHDNYNNNNSYTRSPTRYFDGVKGLFHDREYESPSARKGSFHYDDRMREDWEQPDIEAFWDDDRDHPPYSRDRERERERLDWERGRNSERERDPYPDGRGHPNHYAYSSPQRSASNHTLSPSISRHGSHDYFPPTRRYSYRDHPPPPPSPPQSAHPEYDYRYQRQESPRPMLRTRQGLYSRRESRDRRMENFKPEHDGRSDDEDPVVSDDDDDDDVIQIKIAAAKLEHQAYELRQQRRHREEETKRKEEEARMKEDEFRKKEKEQEVWMWEREIREREIREREQALHVREEELKRREAEAKHAGAESQQTEPRMWRKEAQIQKEDVAAEEIWRAEKEAAKREEARGEEQTETVADQDCHTQEQTEWPIFDIDPPNALSDDLFLDLKLVEEQTCACSQLLYRQRIDTIQPNHQSQHLRHGSLRTDSPSLPGGPPAQPSSMTSNRQPSFTQTSQLSSPSPSERLGRSATSSAWNGAGSTWSSSTKSSPSATNIPQQGKIRTVSFSSDTHLIGSSLHSTPGTEWQRRQVEIAQKDKYRESMSSDIIISGQPMVTTANNVNSTHQQLQHSQASVSMLNVEEENVLAEATAVRYVAPTQVRRRQGSTPASRATGTGTAIAPAAPTLAISAAVAMEGPVAVEKADKRQEVTIEDVSDEDVDNHNESLHLLVAYS